MIGAVDIGGTKLAVGIIAEDGTVLASRRGPTGIDSSYDDALANVKKLLLEVAEQSHMQITGIGIGSTGPIDPFTGEYGDLDHLPKWRSRNPVRDLAEAFGVTVAAENDADAGALGEAAWGSGKGSRRMLYVTIGTGIGGGFVIDHQLYRGANGTHPEFAHQVMDPAGPDCTCGLNGCWETLACGPAMTDWYASQSPTHDFSGPVTAEQICERAREQDALALRAVKREAYYLGLGLANLINLFAPEVIVLGGGMMKSASLFMDGIREIISKGCRFVPFDLNRLILESLGADAHLKGAAQVWHHRFDRNHTSVLRNGL
jgi:glucokinase